MNKKLSFKAFLFYQAVIFTFSLIFLGGMYYLLNDGRFPCCEKKDLLTSRWALQGPLTKEPSSFNLEINNPDDNTVVFEGTVSVSGKTAPKATVIISSGARDIGLNADSKGEFSKVIDLSSGPNTLTITAFDSSGNSTNETRFIYYSEEKL